MTSKDSTGSLQGAGREALIRDGRDEDAGGLIALIGGCFAEYEGCVLDVDGELPELRAVATAFAGWGGRIWVAEHAGRVVGCVGFTPSSEPGGVELRKLYVERAFRRGGLGGELASLVEAEAQRRGARFVDLWSDTRFVAAHAFYDRRGYVRGADTRELHDLSASVEFYFRKPLSGRGKGAPV